MAALKIYIFLDQRLLAIMECYMLIVKHSAKLGEEISYIGKLGQTPGGTRSLEFILLKGLKNVTKHFCTS